MYSPPATIMSTSSFSLKPLRRFADEVRSKLDLLVGRRVHEVVGRPVVVEILHVLRLNAHIVELLAGTERDVHDSS